MLLDQAKQNFLKVTDENNLLTKKRRKSSDGIIRPIFKSKDYTKFRNDHRRGEPGKTPIIKRNSQIRPH
jgi:hypothetical protein